MIIILASIIRFMNNHNENDWEKSLDKDDILIYTRGVETSEIKEFLPKNGNER
jgi:hypothetical protein